MSIKGNRYADFVCLRCGNCCRAPGYVHLKEGEGEAMAAELGISEDEFFEKYTCLGEDRRGLVLIDGADGYCIFLQEDNLCLVQGAKPQQCRDYPYKWRSELLISGCAAEGAVVR